MAIQSFSTLRPGLVSCPELHHTYDTAMTTSRTNTLRYALEYLNCSHNKLNSLPSELTHSQLRTLDASHNNLRILPPGFSTLPLESIDISFNGIIELSLIPAACHTFYCQFNHISSFRHVHVSGCPTLTNPAAQCICLRQIVRYNWFQGAKLK